jgi:hypothetical protein
MDNGCAHCKHAAKSDKLSEQVDICGATYAYLPIYMPVETQRPEWCPGFEGKQLPHETHEKHETGPEQQELFGFRRD